MSSNNKSRAEYRRQYYQDNIDRLREQRRKNSKRYSASEEGKAKRKAYYQQNKEQADGQVRAWKQKYSEYVRGYRAAYYNAFKKPSNHRAIRELGQLQQYLKDAGTGGSPFNIDTIHLSLNLHEANDDSQTTIYRREIMDYLSSRISKLRKNG